VYIKYSGFHGGLGIGTNDHNNGNTYNLIEDVWVWAEGARIIAINYRADYNIWRRVVVRGDGCTTSACTCSGCPNVGFTVYNSKNVISENMIVVDRILNNSNSYGDFATAQHASVTAETPLEGNQWLGCISINSDDGAFTMEADDSIAPSHYLKDCAALMKTSGGPGFNLGGDRSSIIEDCTVLGKAGTSSSIIRRSDNTVNPTTRNCIARGNGQWAVVRGGDCSYIDSYGTYSESRYYGTTCSVGERTTDPLNDGSPQSLKYPLRVEPGSALSGTGYQGKNYGATVVKKYGADGTFYGDVGYSTLTNNNLWPWPNEDRIKADFSSSSTRGFAASGNGLYGGPITLTSYIWEYLGNPCPAEICNYGTQQTCTQAGGTCMANACNTYQSCSSLSGTCTSGYCCSGTCTSDTIPPVRSNRQPTGTLAAGTTSTTISLSTDEAAICRYMRTAGTAYASMNNTFSTTGSTSHSTTVSGLQNGMNHTYYTKCMDGAGNANTDDYLISFIVSNATDSTLPIVSLVSPSNNYLSSCRTIIFNCSATDNIQLVNITLYGNWTGTWRANETQTLTGTSGSKIFTKTLLDGSYLWSCMASDTSSNKAFASSNYTIRIDSIVPMVNIAAPLNNSIETSSNNIAFTYSVSDANTVTNCSLVLLGAVNQTDITITKNASQTFYAVLANGDYNWYINCTDNFNNIGKSLTYRLNISVSGGVPDTAAPSIVINSPANGSTWISSNTVTFAYAPTDASSIDNCSFIFNGTVDNIDTTLASGMQETFTKEIANGNYVWAINCTDSYNNIGGSGKDNLEVSYTVPSQPSSGGGGGGGRGGTVRTFLLGTITEGKVEKRELATGERIRFNVGNIEHTVTVKSANEDSVDLEISSKKLSFNPLVFLGDSLA
jgi:hypothetical protein